MAVFISVLEGADAASATPVLVTRDERILAAVSRAIADCLGVRETPPSVLRLTRTGREAPEPVGRP